MSQHFPHATDGGARITPSPALAGLLHETLAELEADPRHVGAAARYQAIRRQQHARLIAQTQRRQGQPESEARSA